MSTHHAHHTHPEIVKRLKRAAGHLNKVISMIEEQYPCVELAQQLHAVEAAITKAKRTLIQDHIDHCLDETDTKGSSSKSITEFKEITKYL